MKASMRRSLARWDSMGQEAPVVSGTKATLLKYSAALGAAAALATSAEAGIIHTNGPVTATRTGVGTFTAPVNVGLGGDVVNLKVQFGGQTSFGGSQNGEASLFGSAGNVRFAAAQLYDGRAFAVNLAQGDTIGATMANVLDVNNQTTTVNFNATPVVQHNTIGDNVGPFLNDQPGYVGLELTIASNVYYGWLKLKLHEPGQSPESLTAIEWAYNDVAGQSILAGDVGSGGGGGSETPEPATAGLALLAAGSAGVLAWRRRRNSTPAA